MAFDTSFLFKKTLPSFIGHEDVLRYLESYAEHYQLYQHIKVSSNFIKHDTCITESFMKQNFLFKGAKETNRSSIKGRKFDLTICQRSRSQHVTLLLLSFVTRMTHIKYECTTISIIEMLMIIFDLQVDQRSDKVPA